MKNSQKALLGVAVIGLAAAAYIAVKGWPTVGEGSQGTVGAAQRYRAEQIKPGDVVVQDAQLQKFLQSDAFQRVLRDPVARKALSKPEFRKALVSAELVSAIQNPAVAADFENTALM